MMIGILDGEHMKNKTDVNNASYAYSINMLKFLSNSGLITDEEFNKTASISAEHYNVEIYCV